MMDKKKQDLLDFILSLNTNPKSYTIFEILVSMADIGVLGFGSQKLFRINTFDEIYDDVILFNEESFKNALADICLKNEIKPFFDGQKNIHLRGFLKTENTISICFDNRIKAVNFINELNQVIKKIEAIQKEEAYLSSLKPVQEKKTKNKEVDK